MYKLNRRVTLKRYTTLKNEFGGLVPVITGEWSKWSEVRDRTGNSLNDYQQSQWSYTHIFVLRYEKERPTRSNDVIVYENENYKINYIQIRTEGHKSFEYIEATKLDENINSDAPMDTSTIQYVNYTAIGDEYVITDGNLIGKTIFLVLKDGVGFELLTGGTPSGKQVVFNSTLGTLTFGVTFASDEVITYIYF